MQKLAQNEEFSPQKRLKYAFLSYFSTIFTSIFQYVR